jgi:non-ribosomal peptide synthetase component F
MTGRDNPQGKVQLDAPVMTSVQRHMALNSMRAPFAGYFIQQLVWTPSKRVSLGALREAWRTVSRRHDALRVHVVEDTTGDLRAEFTDDLAPDISEVQLGGETNALDQFLAADRIRGFDLQEAPLWRITVLCGAGGNPTVVWCFHHLLLDGRSHWIVFREVLAVLGFLPDETKPTEPELTGFKFFLEFRTNRPQEGESVFWRSVFDRFAHSSVPFRRLSSSRSTRHTNAAFELDEEGTLRLVEFAERVGVSVHNLIQATWGLVLHDRNRTDVVLFGSTRACRHWNGLRQGDAVGMFINTVPFPIRIDGSLALDEWLQSIRNLQREIRPGEFASPTEIRRWTGSEGSSALFDSVLVFEDHDSVAALPPEIGSVAVLEKTDLLTVGATLGRRLRVVVEGPEESLETTNNRDFAASLEKHLSDLIRTDPAAPMAGLLKSVPSNKNTSHSVFGPKLDYAQNGTVVDQILKSAANRPASPAVEQGGRRLSYLELVEAASRWASVLRRAGLRKEEAVILCFSRSADFVVAALGVMMAGGSYVPVDPASVPAQVSFKASDCGARFAIAEPSHASVADSSGCRLLSTDGLAATIAGEFTSSARPTARSYIIYTSGSSGRPKGVEIEHRSLSCLTAHYGAALKLGCNDRVTFLSATTFDASVADIWPCLAHGACLVIPADQEVFGSPRRIIEWLAESKATVASVSTALVEVMFSLPWPPETPLCVLITGGDTLRSYPPINSKFRFINSYGPTENTVDATWAMISPEGSRERPDIGYPISNVSAHILDSSMCLVGDGLEGELYVGGDQVARGYLNDP